LGLGVDVALETSRREGSLALGAGPAILADELGGRAHASDLLARLELLVERAGVRRGTGPLPLRRVFVGLGPGSYTGLRVGIATALGLARASGALLFGLTSFEVLAFAALEHGTEGTVVMDARAGRYYHGRYRRTRAGVEVLEEPTACTPAELVERCARARTILAHPGLVEGCGLALGPLRADARPTGAALLALGRARLEAGELRPAVTLEPLYLMGFARRHETHSGGR
jgi:tRNA threonylcarbamoyladenosine biosynthesis protein TsaB